MTNPIYHDDPEWYERPGETVHLHVDEHASQFAGIALPYKRYHDPVPRYFSEVNRITGEEGLISWRCLVCKRPHRAAEDRLICAYCERAQQQDITHTVRARLPKPQGPIVSSIEPWEMGSRWD